MSVALAAPHPAAIRAGREAVEAGGNAVDAALAAAIMLAVVYPHQCAIGGDLIALIRSPEGETTSVLAAGAAPAAIEDVASRWTEVPRAGAHAVTVPGMFAGWRALAALGGSAPLAAALERAAVVAREGSPVSAGLARALQSRADAVYADAGLRAVFAAEGDLLTEGDVFTQPALARTLEALAVDPDSFYRGSIAAALVRALQADGGVHLEHDFASYRPEVGPALSRIIGRDTWTVAPPPSGGAILLGVVSEASRDQAATPGRLLEAAVRGMRTRSALLADPRSVDVDIDALLALAGPTEIPPGEPRPQGDTAAVVATDAAGWSVTIVQSVYQTFGAGLLDPETGVLFHNRGSAFSADPAHPARIRPGARPPHTLTPAIVDAGEITVVAGCQGGRAQPWILAQLLPDTLDAAVSLDDVLDRPRWVVGDRDLGHDSITLVTEPGVSAELSGVARKLGIGEATFPGPADEAGHVQLVRRGGGRLEAASDPRADGAGVVI